MASWQMKHSSSLSVAAQLRRFVLITVKYVTTKRSLSYCETHFELKMREQCRGNATH